MKIIIFGSTGKTGLEIIRKALNSGNEVTAFARNPSNVNIDDTQLKTVQGDIFDNEALVSAVRDHDAVIVALGTGQSLGKSSVRSEGTANIIEAMKRNDVKRLIVISAMGVGESWKDLSLFNRLFFATLLKNSRADHEAQEKYIKSSELDWTIIRPSGLTDDPGTGEYGYGEGVRSKTSRIARADVAHLVFQALDNSDYFRKALTITN